MWCLAIVQIIPGNENDGSFLHRAVLFILCCPPNPFRCLDSQPPFLLRLRALVPHKEFDFLKSPLPPPRLPAHFRDNPNPGTSKADSRAKSCTFLCSHVTGFCSGDFVLDDSILLPFK